MKKVLLTLSLITLCTLVFGGVALAAQPGTWNDSGPTYRDPDVTAPGVDTPHGTYVTGGDECEVCHSPHQAGIGGASYKLLRVDNGDDACDYCHVGSGAKTTKIVYTDYSTGTVTKTGLNGHEIGVIESGGIPDSATPFALGSGGSDPGSLFCSSCHSPHGANTVGNYPGNKILKNDPLDSGDPVDINDIITYGQSVICAQCHDANWNWVNNYTQYDDLGVNGASHPQSPAGPHTYQSSQYCDNCNAATKSANGGTYILYPHMSTGDALLGNGADRDEIDDVCLGCHNGAGKAVGVDY